jgi:hypothetical protein
MHAARSSGGAKKQARYENHPPTGHAAIAYVENEEPLRYRGDYERERCYLQ